MKFANQSTDSENIKAPGGATNAGDDLKQLSSKSAQEIAKESTDGQNQITGSGADCVEADVQAGS